MRILSHSFHCLQIELQVTSITEQFDWVLERKTSKGNSIEVETPFSKEVCGLLFLGVETLKLNFLHEAIFSHISFNMNRHHVSSDAFKTREERMQTCQKRGCVSTRK